VETVADGLRGLGHAVSRKDRSLRRDGGVAMIDEEMTHHSDDGDATLDGNAAAGVLRVVCRRAMTVAEAICDACGTGDVISDLVAYTRAPGQCDAAVPATRSGDAWSTGVGATGSMCAACAPCGSTHDARWGVVRRRESVAPHHFTAPLRYFGATPSWSVGTLPP